MATVIALVILALARPQTTDEQIEQWSEGIDIMMVIDISESMQIQDFQPNRLESAKEVARNFVKGRFQDRIGLVVFSGDAYSRSPLTTDYELLNTYIDDIVDGIYRLLNKVPSLKFKKKFKNDSISSVAPFRILNIGNTKKIYLLEFINTLEKELNKKIKRNYMAMQKGDVHSTLSDSSLLKRITGYNPKTNYKIGIKKFIKWYLNYYH